MLEQRSTKRENKKLFFPGLSCKARNHESPVVTMSELPSCALRIIYPPEPEWTTFRSSHRTVWSGGMIRLQTDASQYAMGAVLMQKQENKWKPLGYTSKAFNAAQRNYNIYDRELLAIMITLEQHCPQLIGTKQPFEIQTDHANLQFFKKPQKLNRRQAKWLTILQDYDFVLTHIPGKTNSQADILSRRPSAETGQNDNDDTILLPE